MSVLRVLEAESPRLALFMQNKFNQGPVLLSQQSLRSSPRTGPVVESGVLRGISAVEQQQID